MKTFLSTSQRTNLLQAHRNELGGKDRDRLKAILLADEGFSIAHISHVLYVDETTVRRHIKCHLDGDHGHGPGGSTGKLNSKQMKKLMADLNEIDVSTAAVAAEKIFKLFGIKYSISGATSLLKKMGFSYKKNEPSPAQADPIAQASFLKDYKALRKRLPPNETLVFLDACHPCMSTKVAYSWSLKGQRKTVKTTANKKRVNIVGSLNPDDLSMVTTFPKTVNSHSIDLHFRKLRRTYPQIQWNTLHVVLDNGSYHRSEKVKEVAKKLNIKLWFLPPYSPNLNLIERAWKFMNERVRNNVFFADANAFTSAIKNFFQKDRVNSWKRKAPLERARFAEHFQCLKPAI